MEIQTRYASCQVRALWTRPAHALRSAVVRILELSLGNVMLVVVCAGCSLSPSGCSVGGVRPDFELKSFPGTLKFQSENSWAAEMVDGRYRLHNNVWNSKAIKGPYRQLVFVKEFKGKPSFGWVWSVKDSLAPATYPEIQAGFSPWNGEVVPDSGFPFQAGTKKLVVSYDIGLTASGKYDVTLQSWIVSALPPSKKTITDEVVILLANAGMPVPGERVAQASLQGHAWSVHVDENHRDAAGNNTNTWTLITLATDKPILRGSFDVGEVIDFLLKNGYLDPHAYVADLELGTDIMRGAGNAVVRDFWVSVN